MYHISSCNACAAGDDSNNNYSTDNAIKDNYLHNVYNSHNVNDNTKILMKIGVNIFLLFLLFS